MKLFKNIFYAVAIAYIPCVPLFSFIMSIFDKDSIFNPTAIFLIATLFIYAVTLPLYICLCNLGSMLIRNTERGKITAAEKIFDCISILLGSGALIFTIADNMTVSFSLSAAVLVCMILRPIIWRREKREKSHDAKQLAVTAISVILICAVTALTAFVVSASQNNENKIDPAATAEIKKEA